MAIIGVGDFIVMLLPLIMYCTSCCKDCRLQQSRPQMKHLSSAQKSQRFGWSPANLAFIRLAADLVGSTSTSSYSKTGTTF